MNIIHPLLVFLASLTQQELARRLVFLKEENRILRGVAPVGCFEPTGVAEPEEVLSSSVALYRTSCSFVTQTLKAASGPLRLWLSASTRKPDAAWVTQQAERFQQHAKAADLPLTILLRDNDVKYPPGFNEVFRKAAVTVPKMPPRAPNLRAHVERVIQTIQSEILDGMVVVGERHFNHILKETATWYNAERSHSARDYLPPGWDKPPNVDNTAMPSEIVCTSRLGGLLNSYSRRAA